MHPLKGPYAHIKWVDTISSTLWENLYVMLKALYVDCGLLSPIYIGPILEIFQLHIYSNEG